jgi:tetratricopeptide (TPR) repeat protein
MNKLIEIPIKSEDRFLVYLLNNDVGFMATFIKDDDNTKVHNSLTISTPQFRKRISYFDKGEGVFALLYFEQDKNDPSQQVVRIINAKPSDENHRFDKLTEVLAKFSDDPTAPINHNNQAKLLLHDAMANHTTNDIEHFRKAIDLAERAIRLDPTITQAYNCKGACQASLGDNDAAISTYLAAIKTNSKCVRPWLNLGNRYRALGEDDRALYACRIGVERPPLWNGDNKLQIQARSYLASENNRSAETVQLLLARNLEIDSLFSQCRLNDDHSNNSDNSIGIGYCREGNWEKALQTFTSAALKNPNDLLALNNRAHALNQLGRNAEAVTCCNEILNNNPDYHIAVQTKTEALIMLGHNKKALDCLEFLITHHQDNPAIMYYKALIEDELGILPEAVKTYSLLISTASAACKSQCDYAARRIQEFLYFGNRNLLKASGVTKLQAERRNHLNILMEDYSYKKEGNSASDILPGLEEYCTRNNKAFRNIHHFASDINSIFSRTQCHKAFCIIQNNDGNNLDYAIVCCDRVLQSDPTHVDALVFKAEALLQKALAVNNGLDPQHPLCVKAMDCYGQAVGYDARHPWALYSKALAEDALGDTESASKTFRQFLVIAPRGLDSHLHYARTRLHHMEFWMQRKNKLSV